MRRQIIAITGPTASGKSRLAIELAKEINGEIISADSRLIYKDFDIAVAKPSVEDLESVRHHLVNIIDPTYQYTVGNFVDEAKNCIQDIRSRGKIPIVTGGTGLYFRSLLQDYDIPRVEPDIELRNSLEKLSSDELYKLLIQKDEKTALKIHKNNKVKIIRALEIMDSLNMKLSQIEKTKKDEENVLWIGLKAEDREKLYERINARVDIMFEKGIVLETKRLLEKYGKLSIMEATIGYDEVIKYLEGNISLEESIEKIKQNSRRYAKRQLSWMRGNNKIKWFDFDKMLFDKILEATLFLYRNN